MTGTLLGDLRGITSAVEGAKALEPERSQELTQLASLNLIFSIEREVIIKSILQGCWEIKNPY